MLNLRLILFLKVCTAVHLYELYLRDLCEIAGVSRDGYYNYLSNESQHRRNTRILKDEEIIVYVDELAESSVVIGSKSWVKTDDYWPTRWRLLEEIKLTMDEQGINIPYPQMDVHIQKES